MKKRGICVLLAVILAMQPAAGCGGAGTFGKSLTGAEKYKEFITIDVYDEYANYQGLQSGWFAHAVKERFNMELNIIAPNVAGGGDTLFQTRSAAGSLGDLVIINTANGRFNDLVEAGLILECSKLVAGSELMKQYGDAVRWTNELVEAEGIYGFPNSISNQPAEAPSEGINPTFGPFIRWDYYKKLGYPRMENLEDFLDVLEQMQAIARAEEGCEDIYAISLFRVWDDNMMNHAKQLVCMYGYDELGFVLSKADGSDYQSIIDGDSLYVKMLRFLCEANERGLLDPESASQSYDTWTSKYQAGKVLYSPWPWVGQSLFHTRENREQGKGLMLAPVEDMQIFSFGCCPRGDSTQVIAIGADAQDPQRMADFIDWLYSPEGVEINGHANGAQGPQGLTWEMGEDGRPVLTEFGQRALPNNLVEVPEEYGGGMWGEGVSALNFKTVILAETDPNAGAPYDYRCWETTLEANQTLLEEDWRAQMGADTALEYLQQRNMLLVAPGSSYSTPKEEVNITTIRRQCKVAVLDYSWQMISAPEEAFDGLLQELQDTVTGLGYQEVYEVDLKNAMDQNAARKESAERYPLEPDSAGMND